MQALLADKKCAKRLRPTAAKRIRPMSSGRATWRGMIGERRSSMVRDEVALVVEGWPPVKNEAKSMLAANHQYADRVRSLLSAAEAATGDEISPVFGGDDLGLELIVYAPAEPPSDATNYLGGVADVLEAKDRRGSLPHLGELVGVALYLNDRQIHQVLYRWERAPAERYSVRVWRL